MKQVHSPHLFYVRLQTVPKGDEGHKNYFIMLRDELVEFCEKAKGCKCRVTTKAGNIYEGTLLGCQALTNNNLKLARIQIDVNGLIKKFYCTVIEKIEKL